MRVDRSTFAAFVDMLTPFEQPELPFASTHWRFTFNFGPKFGLHGPPSLSEAPEAPPLRSPGGGGGGQYGRQNGEARPRRRRPRAHIVVATTATADADADADRTGLRGSGDDDGNDRYGGRPTPSRESQARRRALHAAESQGTRALGASRAPCGRGARGHAAYGGRNARIERERRATRAASDRLGRGEVVVVQIGRCVAAFTSSLSCPSDRRALRLTRASPANTHQHPPTPST